MTRSLNRMNIWQTAGLVAVLVVFVGLLVFLESVEIPVHVSSAAGSVSVGTHHSLEYFIWTAKLKFSVGACQESTSGAWRSSSRSLEVPHSYSARHSLFDCTFVIAPLRLDLRLFRQRVAWVDFFSRYATRSCD